jgi:hypothetical protein
MPEHKTEFEFPLTTKFKYAPGGGDSREATFIHLTAPTAKHSKECAELKQAFFRACPQEKSGDTDTSGEEITGHDVITLMACSTDVELRGSSREGSQRSTGR